MADWTGTTRTLIEAAAELARQLGRAVMVARYDPDPVKRDAAKTWLGTCTEYAPPFPPALEAPSKEKP